MLPAGIGPWMPVSKQELPAARPGRREEITSRFTKSRADEEGWRSEKCGCGCCWNKEVRCGNCENTLKHQLKSSKKLISVMHIYFSAEFVQFLCRSCAKCKISGQKELQSRVCKQSLQSPQTEAATELTVRVYETACSDFLCACHQLFEDSIHRGAEGQT